jgi:cyclic-di-AMP phosphodiesterase PgpH
MKFWISKQRAQKSRFRSKQTGRTPAQDMPWWDLTPVGLLLGCLMWLSACMLLYAGQPGSADINQALRLASSEVLLLIGIALTAGLLYIINPGVLRCNARILLLALLALLTLIPAKLLLYFASVSDVIAPPVAEFLIPYALAPLLATLLIGRTAGVALGLWTSYACAMFADRHFTMLLTGLISTVVTVCMANNVRRRSQVFRIGLFVGLAQAIAVPVLLDLTLQNLTLALGQTLACCAGAACSAIVALLILPLFEMLFGATTDITLLELSDLGHPLLQRLALEAPGTYHHSLMVASLGQAAADEIRAHALLVRVSAYFHDVGKLTKPEFFSENMSTHENPHDHLSPNMSALLIAAHVKEGLSLGMLHKLPRPILDAIQQHHGTGLITYFHHKADQQLQMKQRNQNRTKEHPTVDETSFRYSGPRPAARETALIMLADAVEAASRSLEKPTVGHIQDLVDRIANSRIEDGQLDLCDLTFAELSKVKRSFVFTLTNMLHSRISYPKP